MRSFFKKWLNNGAVVILAMLSLFSCTQSDVVSELLPAPNTKPLVSKKSTIGEIIVGAEQARYYLPMLQNKRVGLVVNQTSMIGNNHLVDELINIKMDF